MRDYSKSMAAAAAEPAAARETEYFLANISKVKTPGDLISNSRLYAYVLKSFGLSDMAFAKALIRKILEEGIASPRSLANTLNDPRYKALATVFNFAAAGAETTGSLSLQKAVVDNYIEQTLEANAGKQNEGARMALYFRRMAPKITSAYGILADRTLLKVAQTALGLSPSMSLQPVDTQARMITKQLKIADLHDSAKLQKFIERFTAVYDSKISGTAASPANPAIFAVLPGIGPDLLLSLAKLKLGGA
ncbi:MAG TPA: DUF1217 domain-containing protein [Methylocella sp.]|nr:DUF1217 domain-containing protein [Methylocella sp.]